MTPGAIIMMVITMGIVTCFVVYFFIKILRKPLSTGGKDPQNKEG
ncbi:MAG TPA: hypothetical protein VJO14_00470 [Bacteroidota bacterium]|nr:hypothetical protein [Bacteroidota bacterium]